MHFGTDGLSRMMCDPFTVCLRLSVVCANTIGQVMPDFLVLVLRTTIGSLPLFVSATIFLPQLQRQSSANGFASPWIPLRFVLLLACRV